MALSERVEELMMAAWGERYSDPSTFILSLHVYIVVIVRLIHSFRGTGGEGWNVRVCLAAVV